MTAEECRELMEAMRNDGEHGFVYWNKASDRSPSYDARSINGTNLLLYGGYNFDNVFQAKITLIEDAITPAAIRAAWRFMEGIMEQREKK